MLKIAVCDDDLLFGKKVSEMIKKQADVPVEVTCFQNAGDYAKGGCSQDILFLDIDMPGMSGWELAKHLKEQGERPIIIFLTGLRDYVFDAFEVEAAGYLLKPLEEEKLKKALDRAVAKALSEKQDRHVLVKSGQVVHRIAAGEIFYVENQGRKLVFHTKQGEFSCYGRMEDWEKKLPSYFFRCHRGYLVSLKEVSAFDKSSVSLSNGESVLMAKQKYLEFAKACIMWMA